MSGSLERRYRRVLRLLPGWYRERWEQDMVAAFLDSRLTGDPEEDTAILEFCRPGWAEIASVAGLAARLHVSGADSPGQHFAWGQAVRRAVLALTLIQAVRGLDWLVQTAWSRHLFSWLPVPPASMQAATPGGALLPVVWNLVAYAWIASFVTANYLLVAVPLLALRAAGGSAWIPDFPGLYCILVALGCLAHAPRAWSGPADSTGVWSLALTLLAADAGAYRIFSLTDYLHDPHLIAVSLAAAHPGIRRRADRPRRRPRPGSHARTDTASAPSVRGEPRTCRSGSRPARRRPRPAYWPRASCSQWPAAAT